MTFRALFRTIFSPSFWGSLIIMAALVALFTVGMFFFLDIYTNHGKTVIVPDVTGETFDVAEEKLDDAHLRVEVVDTGYISKLPADIVLEQQIPAGTEVKYNRVVYVTVNSATARKVALPSVVDGPLREAEFKLRALGFKNVKAKRIKGDYDLVYRLEVNGREVQFGDRIGVDRPVAIVCGDGTLEDVFNGNDSAAWAMDVEFAKQEYYRRQAQEAQALEEAQQQNIME